MSGEDIRQVWLVTVRIPGLGTIGHPARKAVLGDGPSAALDAGLAWARRLPEFPSTHSDGPIARMAHYGQGTGMLRVMRNGPWTDDFESDVVVRVQRVEVVG